MSSADDRPLTEVFVLHRLRSLANGFTYASSFAFSCFFATIEQAQGKRHGGQATTWNRGMKK